MKYGTFSESSLINPSSPYSASKASAELLIKAYNKTFKMNTSITNCSNNYGPRQHSEKLIPHIIECAINDKMIPVYGDGKNVRDWLYVEDHCEAIDIVFHKGISGEKYNIGGGQEKRNIDIVKQVLKYLNKPESLITFVSDRKGHDYRYSINYKKIKDELGWEPRTTFELGLKKTIDWYMENIYYL